MITSTITPNNTPAAFQRYPLTLRRGSWPHIQSIKVQSEVEESDALEAGYSTVCPAIPPPEEPKPELTLEDRVAEIEADFNLLRVSEHADRLDAAEKEIKRLNDALADLTQMVLDLKKGKR